MKQTMQFIDSSNDYKNINQTFGYAKYCYNRYPNQALTYFISNYPTDSGKIKISGGLAQCLVAKVSLL